MGISFEDTLNIEMLLTYLGESDAYGFNIPICESNEKWKRDLDLCGFNTIGIEKISSLTTQAWTAVYIGRRRQDISASQRKKWAPRNYQILHDIPVGWNANYVISQVTLRDVQNQEKMITKLKIGLIIIKRKLKVSWNLRARSSIG